MSAIDVAAKVRAAAVAAVDKGCFGEDFGVDINAGLAQTPTGGLAVLYTLILSTRSPLLGQGPLVNFTQVASPNPTAEQVEQAVTQAMKSLRDKASEILTGGNPAAVQPG
jgi:hypothetical protein